MLWERGVVGDAPPSPAAELSSAGPVTKGGVRLRPAAGGAGFLRAAEEVFSAERVALIWSTGRKQGKSLPAGHARCRVADAQLTYR